MKKKLFAFLVHKLTSKEKKKKKKILEFSYPYEREREKERGPKLRKTTIMEKENIIIYNFGITEALRDILLMLACINAFKLSLGLNFR
jgi:hypothetical protein